MLFKKRPASVKALKKERVAPETILGVRVRESVRARRLSLIVDTRLGDVVLVLPKRVSLKRAAQFITENRNWIEKHRRTTPPPVPFADGQQVLFCGQPHKIVYTGGRGLVYAEQGCLYVPGLSEHAPRRLRDFLKKQARRVLTERSLAKADDIGVKVSAVRIGDMQTRWGSCTRVTTGQGRLSFSWRLILAPDFVLDYVAAHEVAHIIHMNHGLKFWRLCRSLTQDAGGARKWLRENGSHLQRFV